MSHHPVTILNRERQPVAMAEVELREGSYSGSVDLDPMPEPLRQLFHEYEEIVEGQIFGLLDQVEERVDAASIVVAFADGQVWCAENLQIFPRAGRISFTATKPARPREIRRPTGKSAAPLV